MVDSSNLLNFPLKDVNGCTGTSLISSHYSKGMDSLYKNSQEKPKFSLIGLTEKKYLLCINPGGEENMTSYAGFVLGHILPPNQSGGPGVLPTFGVVGRLNSLLSTRLRIECGGSLNTN